MSTASAPAPPPPPPPQLPPPPPPPYAPPPYPYPPYPYPPPPPPANPIMDGLAFYGRMRAYTGLAGGLIVGVGMIGFGIWALARPKRPTVQATVGPNPRCRTSSNSSSYTCDLPVSYVVAGKPYSATIFASRSGTSYHAGDTLQVEYDPANPSDARTPTPWSLMGGAALVFGVLVIALGAISAYIAAKSKTGAAVVGAAGLLDAIGGRRRR